MVRPFLQSKYFNCPNCGEEGMIAKPEGKDSFYLIGDKFRLEQRAGEQEIVCVACGMAAVPQTSD